jgi:hydroxymethylglutaryl-CoA synthase
VAGIVSYAAYVPFNRLKRSAIGETLGIKGGKGERAVASYDEDTVTMAVEASRACLKGTDPGAVAALYFATTAPPYVEKLNASTIHAATGLPRSVRSLDLACSVRAGIGALLAAHDTAVASATNAIALAALSDIRIGAPEGTAEQAGGDAAVAYAFGTENVIADVEATYSESLEYLATWRTPDQKFAKSWEERFTLTQAYVPLLLNAVKAITMRANLNPNDIAFAVLDAPNPRATAMTAASLKVDPVRIVGDMSGTIGWTGTAHAGLMLADALDRAKPDDRILVLSVSDGVDAIVLRVTDAIASFKRSHTVAQLIESKRNDLSYARYLKWRGLLDTEPPRRPDPQRPAGPPSLRDERWKYGFVGSRCTECGTYQLPPQIVCVHCRAVGKMEEAPFVDRKARIRTFTVDRLAFTPQPPMVVAIVDFDGGGRFQSELTDCEPEKVAIGQELEMTFRRLFTADGIHNYFWKARPAR